MQWWSKGLWNRRQVNSMVTNDIINTFENARFTGFILVQVEYTGCLLVNIKWPMVTNWSDQWPAERERLVNWPPATTLTGMLGTWSILPTWAIWSSKFLNFFLSIAPAPLIGPATTTLIWNIHYRISLKAASLAVLAEPLVDITAATTDSPFTSVSRVIADWTRSEWFLEVGVIPWFFDHCKPRLWIVQSDLDFLNDPRHWNTEGILHDHAYRVINSLLVDYY